jgi:hypothetical protein
MVAEYRSMFLRQLKDILHLNKSAFHHPDFHHPDIENTRIAKDKADIKSLLALLESNWINPFSSDNQDLVSLSTGKVAPQDIENDLLLAKEIGEKAYKDFSKQRLESNPPQQMFFDKMSKQKLKSLTHLDKKVEVCNKSVNELILKADCNLFAHMIIIAESR